MRLLFVHAHPDDETLWNGASIAHHVAAGDEVHVLTCTLGEEGEVIPPELAHLELPPGQAREVGAPDALGAHRRGELREAMTRSGVASSVVLGEQGGPSWRDSGMAGTPSARHPRAFAAADVGEVGAAIRAHLERLDPDVVLTYEEHGGYGHPDHVQTHRGTVEAVRQLPEADRPRLLARVSPQDWYEDDLQWLRQQLDERRQEQWGARPPEADDASRLSIRPAEVVAHEVVDPDVVPRQEHAAAAHATQVRVLPGMFVLSNGVATRFAGREAFARVDPDTGRLLPAPPGPRTAVQP